MAQKKMSPTWTLFPDFLALVPIEAIAGENPEITSFDQITKENSFIINDTDSDSDLILSEDGVSLTYTKTGASLQAFDAGGLGDVDDVTVERSLTIEIGINGFSHDILAMQLGLNPKTDIEEEVEFKKTSLGVLASGVKLRGNIKKEKFFFIAKVPLDDPEYGDLYVCSPYIVVQDADISNMMQNQKVKHVLTFKGLKIIDPEKINRLSVFSGFITNGYELLFWWNVGDGVLGFEILFEGQNILYEGQVIKY